MNESEQLASKYDLKRMAAAEMAKFATKEALNAAIVGDVNVYNIFAFSIDTDTMQLSVSSEPAYAELFTIDENGCLCLLL